MAVALTLVLMPAAGMIQARALTLARRRALAAAPDWLIEARLRRHPRTAATLRLLTAALVLVGALIVAQRPRPLGRSAALLFSVGRGGRRRGRA